ncbi:MAG: methyltransferase domain-containing protein [Myxococcaceae bacterium]
MQKYTRNFYSGISRDGDKSAEVTVPLILSLYKPQSIIDVGCGPGNWLRAFHQAGIQDYKGIDGEWFRKEQLVIPPDNFSSVDLSRAFSFERNYDLALSLEVAEHLPESSADTFIKCLCQLAPAVIFSAAIPGQGGTLHLNEQWSDYWVRKFAANNFQAFDSLRPLLWSNPSVQAHYAQNILVFVRKGCLQVCFPSERAVQDPKSLRVVHPSLFAKRTDPTQYSIKGFILKTIPNYLKAKLGLLK